MTDVGIVVGVGRPFLYAFSSYGPEGVDKALQILKVTHRRPFITFQDVRPFAYVLIN